VLRQLLKTGDRAVAECDASGAQSLIGQGKSDALGTEALKRTGTGTIRWIAPGQPVTMDYRTDRLNIEVDANEITTRITCG
jgi:hypothetical protein